MYYIEKELKELKMLQASFNKMNPIKNFLEILIDENKNEDFSELVSDILKRAYKLKAYIESNRLFDSKYAKDLYHLLRDLRNAGEIDDNLLWLELQMAEKIQDYSIGLEISTQLIARHPDDFQTLVYHIKVLRGLERVEEIKSYKQRINEFNLQKVSPYLVHVIVNIFISILPGHQILIVQTSNCTSINATIRI